jgi:type I restriction enzyme M protein
MNMILHDFPTANILNGNTLAAPKFKEGEQLRTYDYVVANPPFSDKTWSTGLKSPDEFQRFTWGDPPKKQGDYAYLLHIIRSMKGKAKAACILPHGVLFRGNAEAIIREQLVRSGYLKGIIGLPANLFYGTGIPACIVVLDKENAPARRGIFMIDASQGFIKDGNKNRLREQDIHKIVDTFARQAEIARYSRMVKVEEIADAKNAFNLNLPRYIDSTEPEDLQDIDAHLNGGIPERDINAFAADWQQFPGVRAALFEPAGRSGYVRLKLPMADVKNAIFSHSEFEAFQQRVTKLFAQWRTALTPRLMNFGKGDHPKELIRDVSETLLVAMQAAPILDPYDVYQHVMDYWAETMQDDCYLIAGDGWLEAAQPRLIVEDKNNKTKARPDFVLGKKKYQTELIPPALIIQGWFADEQTAIEKLEADLAAHQQELEDLTEEHGGDEGAFSSLDKINRVEINRRLKEIDEESVKEGRESLRVAEDPVPFGGNEKSESEILLTWLNLDSRSIELSRKLKAAQETLIENVAAKYPKLTENEIQMLVVEDKWLATIDGAVNVELDRVSQTLTGRIRQLAERYATPLPRLTEEVATLAARVDEYLEKMGAVWK